MRALEIDDTHMRDVEDARSAAYCVVLGDLCAVVHRHIPTAEIDDAGAQFPVQREERCLMVHRSSGHGWRAAAQTKKGRGYLQYLAPLSCDLRDQALELRRSPSVGGPTSTALQSSPGILMS